MTLSLQKKCKKHASKLVEIVKRPAAPGASMAGAEED